MSFINPAFLAALAALAVPLAIHFLRSRRLTPLDLGTLRFVRQALAEVTRWERLRDLLLLALRLSMVALAAFLFARPFLDRTPPPESGDGTELICVLDASASTRFTAPGAAKPGSVPPNAAFEAFASRLAAAPRGAKTVALALADTLEQVADAAAAAPLVGGPCDFAALARWVSARAAADPLTPRRVVFCTDLQRPAAGLPADVTWPEEVPFEIVAVVPPSARNLAVGAVRDRLRPLPGTTGTSGPAGTVAGTTIPIPIEIVGDAVPQPLAAAAGAGTDPAALPETTYPPDAREVEMRLAPTAPGDVDAVVRIRPRDPWPMDDQRATVVRFVGRVPVLLVDGAPGIDSRGGVDPFAAETYFLRQALTTPDRGQTVSAFDVTVTQVPARDLAARPWRAVALCNVARLDDAALARLTALVEAGTGLLLFPGDTLDAAAWSRLHAAGLCPAVVAPTSEPAVPRPFAEWDATHPALAPFSMRLDGDLSRIVLRDSFAVQPDADATVIGSMPGPRPALVAKQHGRGRVVLFANPADRDWTDFPGERIYLPFMQSLFRHAARIGSDADQAPFPDRPLALADRRLPGRHPDAVVHVPDAESSEPFLAEDEFRAAVGLTAGPVATAAVEHWKKDPAAARPGEWWPWLAVALLVLASAEPFLADHHGRPARSPRGARP